MIQETTDQSMRSKLAIIPVTFHSSVGPAPGLIHLAHRSLEKGQPRPIDTSPPSHANYLIPLDLLRKIDPVLTKGIKSITLGYRRKS